MKVSMHNWMRPEPIQATIERPALALDWDAIARELQGIGHLRAALGAAV